MPRISTIKLEDVASVTGGLLYQSVIASDLLSRQRGNLMFRLLVKIASGWVSIHKVRYSTTSRRNDANTLYKNGAER
jgi:hypothetical protein